MSLCSKRSSRTTGEPATRGGLTARKRMGGLLARSRAFGLLLLLLLHPGLDLVKGVDDQLGLGKAELEGIAVFRAPLQDDHVVAFEIAEFYHCHFLPPWMRARWRM